MSVDEWAAIDALKRKAYVAPPRWHPKEHRHPLTGRAWLNTDEAEQTLRVLAGEPARPTCGGCRHVWRGYGFEISCRHEDSNGWSRSAALEACDAWAA